MTRKQTLMALAAGVLFVTNFPFLQANAKPLSSDECGALRQQRTAMKSKGIGAHLEKSAKWASENLNKDQLGDVARFVYVLEKIRFRCSQRTADKKSRYGLHRSVPLPVRNSLRLKSGTKKAQGAAGIVAIVSGEAAGVSGEAAGKPAMRKSLAK